MGYNEVCGSIVHYQHSLNNLSSGGDHDSDIPYSGFFSRAINFANFANDNHFTKINSSNFINLR